MRHNIGHSTLQANGASNIRKKDLSVLALKFDLDNLFFDFQNWKTDINSVFILLIYLAPFLDSLLVFGQFQTEMATV